MDRIIVHGVADSSAPAPTDLALEALTAMQALEAETVAQEYRERWLDGRKLGSEVEAVEWMASVAGPREPWELVVRIPLTRKELKDLEVGRKSGIRDAAARVVSERIGIDDGRIGRERKRPTIEYEEVESQRGYIRQYWAEPNSALGDLADTLEKLERDYRWERQAALRFVLGGVEPVLPLIRVKSLDERAIGWSGKSQISSPMLSEITVIAQPQATKKQVGEAYDFARRARLERGGIPPGERNRRTSSPRTKYLAILAARMKLGQIGSWDEAFETYEKEHPEDAKEYILGGTRRRMNTFRRDTKDAFKRVTGREFGKREGGADDA